MYNISTKQGRSLSQAESLIWASAYSAEFRSMFRRSSGFSRANKISEEEVTAAVKIADMAVDLLPERVLVPTEPASEETTRDSARIAELPALASGRAYKAPDFVPDHVAKLRRAHGDDPRPALARLLEELEGDETDDLQKWRAFANAWGFKRRRCSDMREMVHNALLCTLRFGASEDAVSGLAPDRGITGSAPVDGHVLRSFNRSIYISYVGLPDDDAEDRAHVFIRDHAPTPSVEERGDAASADRYPLWCVDRGESLGESQYLGPFPDQRAAEAAAAEDEHDEQAVRKCRQVTVAEAFGRETIRRAIGDAVDRLDEEREPDHVAGAWAQWDEPILAGSLGGELEDELLAVAMSNRFKASVFVCEGDDAADRTLENDRREHLPSATTTTESGTE